MRGHRQARRILIEHLTGRRQADGAQFAGFAYRGPADFVLRHGHWSRPVPYPERLPSLAPRLCYGNSIFLACKMGWKYVEGYMLMPRVVKVSSDRQRALADPDLGVVIAHAWNLDAQGRLRDATLGNGGLAYRGVEFSLERADDCTWNGDGSVLFDEKRGWPLLREPWTGEPEGKAWPPSPRLECIRQGSLPMLEKLGQEIGWTPPKSLDGCILREIVEEPDAQKEAD